MKTVFFILSLLSASIIITAQDRSLCNYVDIPAEFPGGIDSMKVFIERNLKYTDQMDIQAKVYVNFVVEKDGEITTIKIIKGVHPTLDEEAIRIIKLMPKWEPAIHNEDKVRSNYTIPISFILN